MFRLGRTTASNATRLTPGSRRSSTRGPIAGCSASGCQAIFGNQQLVWNLTVRGETLRALGWLEPTWQTAATAAGSRQLSDEAARNTAPTITVDALSGVTVGSEVPLTARVTDDGLPIPREAGDRAPGSNDPPSLQADPDAPEQPHNVPAVPIRRQEWA